jgi:hypothetical protein
VLIVIIRLMDIFQVLKSFVNKQEVILIDYKGRTLKIGERVCIQEDIPSVDGMLYKNTIVKVEALKNKKIRVQDRSGKLWWVGSNQVSASFL